MGIGPRRGRRVRLRLRRHVESGSVSRDERVEGVPPFQQTASARDVARRLMCAVESEKCYSVSMQAKMGCVSWAVLCARLASQLGITIPRLTGAPNADRPRIDSHTVIASVISGEPTNRRGLPLGTFFTDCHPGAPKAPGGRLAARLLPPSLACPNREANVQLFAGRLNWSWPSAATVFASRARRCARRISWAQPCQTNQTKMLRVLVHTIAGQRLHPQSHSVSASAVVVTGKGIPPGGPVCALSLQAGLPRAVRCAHCWPCSYGTGASDGSSSDIADCVSPVPEQR